jgi:hypothetical protein
MLAKRKRKNNKPKTKIELHFSKKNTLSPCKKPHGQSNRYWTIKNYKTLENLKIDLEIGKDIEVFQPDPYGALLKNGLCEVHGDVGDFFEHGHWYVICEILNGIIVPGSLHR